MAWIADTPSPYMQADYYAVDTLFKATSLGK